MDTSIPILEHPIQHLLSRIEHSTARWLVGIAGVPGSGKSTLAARLVSEINARAGQQTAVALGMDGFHLTKAQLSQLPHPAEAFARRGAPWTFDVEAFFQRLQKVRTEEGRGAVVWPDFQHDIGDPVEGTHVVLPTVRLVLVEGLYLCHDMEGWRAIRECFDELCYLDTPKEIAMERLLHRHMNAWGLTRDDAARRIAGNDAFNATIVMESRKFSHWRIVTADVEGNGNSPYDETALHKKSFLHKKWVSCT